MQLTVNIVFLVMGVISFPTLFFRGEYNAPLMLFCFACWQKPYKGFITWVLILSWLMDIFLLFKYVSVADSEELYNTGEKGQIILVVSIVILASKTLVIIYLMIFDTTCSRSITPSYLLKNLKDLGNTKELIRPKEKNKSVSNQEGGQKEKKMSRESN